MGEDPSASGASAVMVEGSPLPSTVWTRLDGSDFEVSVIVAGAEEMNMVRHDDETSDGPT